jgi:hypothetical protein
MKHTITGAALVAALTLVGVSAHASCSDPRTVVQQGTLHNAVPLVLPESTVSSGFGSENAAENIVGTWHVTYTVEGAPFAQAFIQWHSDRTEWENINVPLLGGNICMGSWKTVDRSHVSRNHIGWMYSNGNLVGYFTETETDFVASNGASYSGTNDQKIYDLTGTLLAEVTGTAIATRIWP